MPICQVSAAPGIDLGLKAEYVSWGLRPEQVASRVPWPRPRGEMEHRNTTVPIVKEKKKSKEEAILS